ncbi:NUDIX hydrolase [Citrobacter sp. FP75]|uniref:NUDIX hydrolase n=1 Tax=Citrobacter sp. FP75 TaxID=1852949 RepID=UPI001BCA2FA5|nr:NUDIX domain-containing protein [Citrobacter sp. FP75]
MPYTYVCLFSIEGALALVGKKNIYWDGTRVALNFSGQYCFPGGAIEAQDDIDDGNQIVAAQTGALRELHEETGIIINPMQGMTINTVPFLEGSYYCTFISVPLNVLNSYVADFNSGIFQPAHNEFSSLHRFPVDSLIHRFTTEIQIPYEAARNLVLRRKCGPISRDEWRRSLDRDWFRDIVAYLIANYFN